MPVYAHHIVIFGIIELLPGRLMVGQRTLDPFILVRIQARQQIRTITLKLEFSYKDQMGLDRSTQPNGSSVDWENLS